MKTIDELIAANQQTAVAKADKTRFMLELDPSVRERLRTLCKDKLGGAGEIKFASELFTVALADAEKAVTAALEAKKARETAATAK